MSAPMLILLVLFVAYCVMVTWEMRRAMRTREPRARLARARTLLLIVSLGVPLALAFIYFASPAGPVEPRVP